MSAAVPCPTCARANAAHRTTCLYCGAAMPNPAAPPPRAARPSAENLDILVREVMRGGSIDKLKAALARPAAEPSPPADAAREPGPPPERPHPPPVVPLPVVPYASAAALAPASTPPAAPPAPAASAASLLAEARLHLVAAERAIALHDPAGARRAVLELHTRTTALIAALDAAPGDPATDPSVSAPALPPLLAPIRLPYALVVDGLGDVDRAPTLAEALSIDVATARTLAVTRHSVVALRAEDPSPLHARVRALRGVGLRGTVLARRELQSLAPALPVVRYLPDGHWLLGRDDPWNDATDALSAQPLAWVEPALALADVYLLVLGEVETRLIRAAPEDARRSRGPAPSLAGTPRRRAVVDLHTPLGILRIVEGMTDLSALAPGEPNRAALRLLVETAHERWPTAAVEPRRLCPAAHEPPGVTGVRLASGWPTFEEHTRMCRLHHAGETREIA